MSTVNIDSRGYGKIYKAVMRNRHLPLLAKTIYSYFCTYAGNGTTAYPKRDKIVRDLKINKDTYTKHLNILVSGGYIAKERTAAGNVYTILQTVPGYDRPVQAEDEMTDLLILENVKAQGFGTVPKLVMLDTRLTAQAKAIYSYFASFAGGGTSAFPRRTTITWDLNLSPAAYYSHFNLLLHCGYLTVEHRKNNGKFDVSLYRLADSVEAPPLPHSPPRKGNRKAMSEKPIRGKNGDTIGNSEEKGESEPLMSEKQVHGEMLKTDAALSEKPMSEEPISEKIVNGKTGHTNINNSSTTNNSFEKEQGYYHQGFASDDKKPVPLLSLEQAKEIIRYDDLRCDALAWGELKAKLGHFATRKDKARYMRKIIEILDETARQAQKNLNAAHDSQRVAAVLGSEAFTAFFGEILDRWDEIRSAKGYVGAALKNMLKDNKFDRSRME